MRTTLFAALAAAAMLCSLGGCVGSNTQIVSSWRDPDVGRIRFKKLLAVAMVRDEARRRVIEDRMVADMQRTGAQALPSYKLISSADTRNDVAVKAAMSDGGFDGAVAWRTVAVTNDTHYVPGSVGAVPIGYQGFWGYYHMGWATVYEPGYLETDKIVQVETLVYAVTPASDKLVWSGTSQTIDPRSLDSLVDGVSSATINAMRQQGLI